MGASPALRARAASRRRRVAELRVQGLTIPQIAQRLKCSITTVGNHLAALGLRAEARTGPSKVAAPPPFAPPETSRRRDVCPPSSDKSETVALAARFGDLAFAYTEGLRAEVARLERQLVDLQRRHAQEVAAAKAEGQRRCRSLEASLATQTARADELQERVTFAERRAEAAVTERAALERLVPTARLVQLAPAD